jgi:hypothetical protein
MEFLSQMDADKSKERCSQMSMRVASIVIQRQCWPPPSAARVRPTAAKLLRVDRLWRFITQAVKK